MSLHKSKYHKLFILALFLLNVFNWIVFNEETIGIPKIFKYILSLSILCIFIYYRIISPSKPFTTGFFYILTLIFMSWSLFLLIWAAKGFNNIFYIQRVFGQPYFYIPYILPIIVLYTKFDIEFFSYLFYYSYLAAIAGIFVQLLVIFGGISQSQWSEQLSKIGIFNIGASFLLLTAHYSKKSKVFIISLIFNLLMLVLFFVYARRGMIIEYTLLIMIMLMIQLRSPYRKFNFRVKIYLTILFSITFLLLIESMITSSYLFERGGFSQSALEESRGQVFRDFFFDFNSISDWVFGRGLEGKVLRSINQESGMSDLIENGLLTVLLKGGLLYLIPFLSILIRASYLGLFNSKNHFTKALAVLILIYIIMMLYFNLPVFATSFVFILLSVSACLNSQIRNMRNDAVYKILNSRFKNN